MYILGFSAYFHDSAACILKDGVLLAAAEEERFTRIKHDCGFPSQAISSCLDFAEISFNQLDYVVFYEKPFLKFERILENYLGYAPKGFSFFRASAPSWLTEKLFLKSIILKEIKNNFGIKRFDTDRLLFSEHHLSHAASAFYPSPFDEAAILTMDGVGEWATTSLAVGTKSDLQIIKEIHYPHSLGLFYSAFTAYLGFRVNSGEYKVMGLAPYGQPKFAELIKDKLIRLHDDGSFALNLDYFSYCTDLSMTNEKFDKLFSRGPRAPESQISRLDVDLAASVQNVLNEAVLNLARHAMEVTGKRFLCLAGGVALNCVSNSCIRSMGLAADIWVQPAAGDSGGAIGAAFAAYHLALEMPRRVKSMSDLMLGARLGPSFSQEDVVSRLSSIGARFEVITEDSLIDTVARSISDGAVVGWFSGRMEFGPRALGSRSILADPRRAEMQQELNEKIKFRETFRPFAPSVLAEYVGDWFDTDHESPYMLFVANVNEKRRSQPAKGTSASQSSPFQFDSAGSMIPAVTHVDFSARVQTVRESENPRYYSLLMKFHEITGCPILINTSFNIRGEPIVCTPEDAFLCFMNSGIDLLVIENCILRKEWQTHPGNYIRKPLALD